MKKSKSIYYLIIALIVSAAVASALLMPLFLPLAVLTGIWWVMFYRRLSYTLTANELIISSGVLLKKLRCVRTENIQWVMRLKLPLCKTASLSALHTASGTVVIFGECSTNS